MTKRLIFSDLHFGDRSCSLRHPAVANELLKFVNRLGRVDEMVLAGDILDANISSLTTAIEGKTNQLGFRGWLQSLFVGGGFKTGRVVYVPGNHDYVIWNILSTAEAFVEPMSKGTIPKNLPLMHGEYPNAFIAGAAPAALRQNFHVCYPDYFFDMGGRHVLITHGHYLDAKQTLFNELDKLIKEQKVSVGRAVRELFIATAQYQAVANAVSYTKRTRRFVDSTHKAISLLVDAVGRLRNQPIDAEMLRAIEFYIKHFHNYIYKGSKVPDVFIFGHTHEAGRARTDDFGRVDKVREIRKKIDVWNCGSFLEGRRAGTFLLLEEDASGKLEIQIMEINKQGKVKPV